MHCKFILHVNVNTAVNMSSIQVFHHRREHYGSKVSCAHDRDINKCMCTCSQIEGGHWNSPNQDSYWDSQAGSALHDGTNSAALSGV